MPAPYRQPPTSWTTSASRSPPTPPACAGSPRPCKRAAEGTRGSAAFRPSRQRPGLRCWHFAVYLGGRALLDQRPAVEQGSADERTAGEEARGPPERGVVAVHQRLSGQGLAADQPDRGEMRRRVGGNGGGEDGVQQ